MICDCSCHAQESKYGVMLCEECCEGQADIDLLNALKEARPYVFNRIDHRKDYWRSQTASEVLKRIDRAISAAERRL
jgi:hypothetical protein